MRSATVAKLDDYRNRVPRKPRRRSNDPLQSPLVRAVREGLVAAKERFDRQHEESNSREHACTTWGTSAGLKLAIDILEYAATELAKKATL